jgi:teichuronic acid biosynthesis glycosyltransferase TuaC
MAAKKLHICIITPDYPGKNRPMYTFVEQLVIEFADLGANCTVVAPLNVTRSIFGWIPFDCKYELKTTKKGNEIEVYRPRYISFSNFALMNIELTSYFHKCAVNKALKKLKRQPDILYSHFWISGAECYEYAISNNIPLFVATGESVIYRIKIGQKFKLSEFCDYVSGVICVSRKNKIESIEKGLTIAEKCIVIPNGVNLKKFNNREKSESRRALGYSDSDFIVAFVGRFTEHKGSMRLSSAINRLDDKGIKSIFIGSGPLEPDCNGILFKGMVNHDQVPDYLNCADVFALPTLREGCSNAIVEAMACGLPVISSDLKFNEDILNNENAILIDPNNISAIANAIKEIKDNPQLRASLSAGALKTSESLSVRNRAEKIIKFITSF